MLARSGAARLFRIGLAVVLLLGLGIAPGASTVYASGVPNCRFGVVSVAEPVGTQVLDLGVGNYLDGRYDTWDETSAPGVDYIRVIWLSDGLYPLGPGHEVEKTALESLISTSPGETWLIGNEPDNLSGDNLTPEVYAARYFAAANWMKQVDPTAKLGFGSITQPSPLRLRYLDRAWQALISLAGSRSAASSLVDVWSIHAFRMSEMIESPLEGAGIPPGMVPDPAEVYGQVVLDQATAVPLFGPRIAAFRVWMALNGNREKPLWITSYGVRYTDPDILQGNITKFLTTTVTLTLENRDPSMGMPADDDRLVQRWFWYSLNDPGTPGYLYDSSSPPGLTIVGKAYVAALPNPPDNDVLIAGLKITPAAFSGTGEAGTEQVTVKVGNAGSIGTGSNVNVELWDGDPHNGGHLITSNPGSGPVPGCGGEIDVPLTWTVLPFESHTLYVHVALAPDAGIEANITNNDASFPVVTGPPRILLPLVAR